MKEDYMRTSKFIIMDYSLLIRDILNVTYFANYMKDQLKMAKYFIVMHVIFLSAPIAWKKIALFVIKISVDINKSLL